MSEIDGPQIDSQEENTFSRELDPGELKNFLAYMRLPMPLAETIHRSIYFLEDGDRVVMGDPESDEPLYLCVVDRVIRGKNNVFISCHVHMPDGHLHPSSTLDLNTMWICGEKNSPLFVKGRHPLAFRQKEAKAHLLAEERKVWGARCGEAIDAAHAQANHEAKLQQHPFFRALHSCDVDIEQAQKNVVTVGLRPHSPRGVAPALKDLCTFIVGQLFEEAPQHLLERTLHFDRPADHDDLERIKTLLEVLLLFKSSPGIRVLLTIFKAKMKEGRGKCSLDYEYQLRNYASWMKIKVY